MLLIYYIQLGIRDGQFAEAKSRSEKTTTNFCERGIVAQMSGREKTKKFLLLCPMGELRLETPINTCTVHELPGFDINYSNLHKYHPIVQIYQDRTCRRNPNLRNFVFGEIESLDCCLHWAPNWTIREMPETGTEKANTTTLGWVLNTRQVRSNTKNVSEGKRKTNIFILPQYQWRSSQFDRKKNIVVNCLEGDQLTKIYEKFDPFKAFVDVTVTQQRKFRAQYI